MGNGFHIPTQERDKHKAEISARRIALAEARTRVLQTKPLSSEPVRRAVADPIHEIFAPAVALMEDTGTAKVQALAPLNQVMIFRYPYYPTSHHDAVVAQIEACRVLAIRDCAAGRMDGFTLKTIDRDGERLIARSKGKRYNAGLRYHEAVEKAKRVGRVITRDEAQAHKGVNVASDPAKPLTHADLVARLKGR